MSENTTNINNKLTVGRATVEPATMSNGNVLFSLQPYIEKEYIPDHAFLISNEDPTIETIDDANAPYSKVLRFIGNNSDCYLGEKIPVSAGERIYLELWYMIPADDTGTAGVNFLGVKRYDKDEKVAYSNGGRLYVASGVTFIKDGDWHKMSGYYTVESSHTPYTESGQTSDGGAIRYLDITLILNYTQGTQEINISGLTIKKVNSSYDEGDTAFKGDVGIGTDDPSAKLHVVGNGDSSATDALLIENSNFNEIFSVANNGVVTIQDPAGVNGSTIINNDPALTGTNGQILTALGHRALRNSTGNRNIGIGYEAGGNISGTGTGESVSIGYYAGNNFVGAGYITAIGSNALRNATTSNSFNRSVAVGMSAGNAALNIASCTFIGANSGADSDGNSNTALGFSSLRESTGNNNIGIGSSAGYQTTTSNNNILIGERSAFGATIGSGNVFIGHRMQDGSTENLTNTIILGAPELERMRIDSNGNMGLAITSPDARLHIKGETNDGTKDTFHFQNSDNSDYITMNNAGRVELRTANSIPFLINRPNGNGVLQFRNDANEGSITYYGNSEARYGTGVIQNGTEFEYHVGYSDTNTADLPSMTSRMILKHTGQLQLSSYTSTTHDGTPTAILGVDASGNVVKTTPLTTPTLQQVIESGADYSGGDLIEIQTTDEIYLMSESVNIGDSIGIVSFLGTINFSNYQSSGADGTPVKTLGVDAAGDLVKFDTPNLQQVIDAGGAYSGTDDSITITCGGEGEFTVSSFQTAFSSTNVTTISGANGVTLTGGGVNVTPASGNVVISPTTGDLDVDAKEIDITASATAADTDAHINISNTATGTNGEADIVIEAQDKLKLKGGNVMMPTWAGDSQRPTATGLTEAGTFGFNVTRNTIEVYNGTAWVQMS